MPRFSVVCLALCLLIVETRGPSSSYIVSQPGSSTCSSLVQGSYTTRMAESVHEDTDTEADESLRLKKGRMRPLAPLRNAAKASPTPKAVGGPSVVAHKVTRHVEAAQRPQPSESSVRRSDSAPPKAAPTPGAARPEISRHAEASMKDAVPKAPAGQPASASPAVPASPAAVETLAAAPVASLGPVGPAAPAFPVDAPSPVSTAARPSLAEPIPAGTAGAAPAAPQSGAQEQFPQLISRLQLLPEEIASSVRRLQLSGLGSRLSLNRVSTSVLVLLVLCFVSGVICCVGLAMVGGWKEPRKDGEQPSIPLRIDRRQESKGLSRPRTDAVLPPPSAQQSFPMPGPASFERRETLKPDVQRRLREELSQVVSSNPASFHMPPASGTAANTNPSSFRMPPVIEPNLNFGGPAGSGGEATGPHLCPELVVPEGSECTLLVPRLPLPASLTGGMVSVDDARGVPVFQASFGQGRLMATSTRMERERRLTLTSATGDAVFAFCRDRDGESGLMIHHHSDAPFGVLEEGSDCYVVSTKKGWKITFRGDLQEGNVCATDEDGRLLAVSEPAGSRRSVRIGPLVDAGLVALAMLGMDTLDQQNTKKREKGRLGSVI